MKFRKATELDIPQIEKLLAAVSLHNQDVLETIIDCIVVTIQNEIIGTAAIEYCDKKSGLLKSFAIEPKYQNKKIGKQLFQQILSNAHQKNINHLYLLTTTAQSFFSHLNFKPFSRNTVPQSISETNEFKTLCASTASCMDLNLEKTMHYYPKSSLILKESIEGVKLWSVSLVDSQFTYFEVEPDRDFEMHIHESEQITYILEGELYFKTETETICVKKGETIAIPSNLRHGAFTREKPLKAVDSWAPINPKYS